MMWHHYYGMPFLPAGGLLLLLLLAGAALTAWALLRRPSADAATILAQRYARGEIGDEEYERRRQRLRMP